MLPLTDRKKSNEYTEKGLLKQQNVYIYLVFLNQAQWFTYYFWFIGESHDENSENDSKKSSRVDNIATPDDINTAEGGIQQLRGPNFDPPLPSNGHFTIFLYFVMWPPWTFYRPPPLTLHVHLIIECPLKTSVQTMIQPMTIVSPQKSILMPLLTSTWKDLKIC